MWQRSSQTEIIVDNTDVGFSVTGSWFTSTSDPGFYGSNYRLHAPCGSPCPATASWSFSVPTTAVYSVYAWWPTNQNFAQDAPYTVNHASGATPVSVNQRRNGGHWNLLGTFTFNQGTSYSLSLTGTASGNVVADAVRIVAGANPPGPFGMELLADAYTSSISPSSNFGGATTMRLLNNGSSQQWGFVKFDLTQVGGNLQSVVLSLNGHGPSGTTTVSVYPVSDTSWDESTITWNNQPTPGANPLATTSVKGTNNATYTWDITNYAQSERAAGRNVISLAVKGINTSATEWVFNTKDAPQFHPMVSGTSAAAPLYFVHVDHLNTPRAVYDANQQLRWKWDQQEPFGVNAPDENPSALGVFEFPPAFTGTYRDKETNLLDNWYRTLDPARGQYLQSDPIGLRGGINTYAYVESNPIALVDPTGLVSPERNRPDNRSDRSRPDPRPIGAPNPTAVDTLARISVCMYDCERERRAEAQKYCTVLTLGVTALGSAGHGPGVGMQSGLICAFGCPYLLERYHVRDSSECERRCYRTGR